MSSTDISLLDMLRQQLDAAWAHDAAVQASNHDGTVIDVPPTGKTISGAYEQLRNAAEYTEEHLLLQRAIKRFFMRNFAFFTLRHGQTDNVGDELIVELTHAGYLRKGQFSTTTAARIRDLTGDYMHAFSRFREAHIPRDKAIDWAISGLAVEIESILNPHSQLTALAYVAYQHYLQLFSKEALVESGEQSERYDLCLYIAVHQALLKSDIAETRYDLMRLYHQSPLDTHAFIQFNRTVDELYTAPFTNRLKRMVGKYGAPMRVLKSIVEERDDLPELLLDRTGFLDAYTQQINKEYRLIRHRISRGIIKSVLFIFITKMLIGVGIEVPYDLLIVGSIDFLPLAINLLFPPLYMASLRFGLRVPSSKNTHTLRDYIDKTLFENTLPSVPAFRDSIRSASAPAKWLFTLLFFIPFGITIYVLHLLHFNFLQAIIFFTFLSTASFFGFRLSSLVRELELVTHQVGLLSSFRDFFYLPFIIVGQWLSSKYARINVVAYFLDIAIELPLKTVLRLVRQWTRFLNEKHDEIY